MDKIRRKADAISQVDFKNMLIIWLFQLLVCWYVVKNTQLVLDSVYANQLKTSYGALRLITMIVMHVQVVSEYNEAIKMMKYAINHPWKFRNW